jgi:Fe(3+) dicitrate transport protein
LTDPAVGPIIPNDFENRFHFPQEHWECDPGMSNKSFLFFILAGVASVAPLPGLASEPDPATTAKPTPTPPEPALVFRDRVTVVGSQDAADRLPGSATILSGERLENEKQGFDDIHRLLGPVPGINIQEEEGFGHRPNIGMRGAGSDRSARIALMEDGVLIAPAPYAAPSAYYFPVAGRMEAIEVRKGSSQIQYGPNTVGGALNLVSAAIPDPLSLLGRAELGSEGAAKLHARAGDAGRRVGWLLETYQSHSDGFKQLDGGGDTGFTLQDYLGKLRFQSAPDAAVYQQLELKLGHTREDADETYLGLTEEDFRITPLRRYAASRRDRFESTHAQYQLRWFAVLPGGLDATVTAYRNDFSRNWYKLQSVQGRSLGAVLGDPAAFAEPLSVLRGGDSEADALRIRANDRDYVAGGVEALVGLRGDTGGLRHDLELGLRFHVDEEDRFQHEDAFAMRAGELELTTPGAAGSQANRLGEAEAWSAFVTDRLDWGRWSLSPGLRFERIELVRSDWSGSDANRADAPRRLTNRLEVVIPGAGLAFEVSPSIRLFGGVHRGFAPPGPGSNEETIAESSLNYELGLRVRQGTLRAEAIGFYNDYENLLGRDTLSTGGSGSGDLFNGGSARIAGLELLAELDAGSGLGLGVRVPLRASYTLTSAHFGSDFESAYEPWGTVLEGDEIPYLPRHQLFASAGAHGTGWGADLSATWSAAMRTSAGTGPIPDTAGTDAQLVLNLAGSVDVGRHLQLVGSVQNLTDAAYVVARRPAGARPGLPRTFLAGVRFRFGG